MLTLPEVSLLHYKDYSMELQFFEQCIAYSNKASLRRADEPTSYNLETLTEWLGQSSRVYICTRNNKKIGFIVVETKETSEGSVTFSNFYVHPRVCKLATVSLARATAVLTYFELISNSSATFLTTTLHGLVYNTYNTFYDVFAIKHLEYYVISASIKPTCKEYLESHYTTSEVDQYYSLFFKKNNNDS